MFHTRRITPKVWEVWKDDVYIGCIIKVRPHPASMPDYYRYRALTDTNTFTFGKWMNAYAFVRAGA